MLDYELIETVKDMKLDIETIKAILDDRFDTDEGREELEELAEYIETNLNDI